jgi:hypothetical protein
MKKSVSEIQSRLAELGIYKGTIDGRTGPQTKAAIRGFQRLNSLTPDGIAGPKTQDALWPAIIPQRDADLQSDAEDAVPPDVPMWPRQRDMEKFYGPVGKNQTILVLPFTMKLAWDLRQPIHRFSIHEKCHDSAKRCFERIADAYTEEARERTGINIFGGCLNVRKMRGGSSWSMHAWGAAIDFDPARNQLRWTPAQSRLMKPDCEAFWRIWESEGWVSLGRTRGIDAMHVQAARL